MQIQELAMITEVVSKGVEVWMEDKDGKQTLVADYDFELNNNRIVLKTNMRTVPTALEA